MSSAYIAICVMSDLGISEVYKLYNIGDSTEPWGTPANMDLLSECALSIFTLNECWGRKEFIILVRSPGNFIAISLNTKPMCQVVS